jgi:hypothetical protein
MDHCGSAGCGAEDGHTSASLAIANNVAAISAAVDRVSQTVETTKEAARVLAR